MRYKSFVWLLLICSRAAFGFAAHYLITYRALPADLDARIEPESLDAFLRAEKEPVAKLFADYYAWLKARGAKRFVPRAFDTAKTDEAAFLSAARLNPKARFRFLLHAQPSQQLPWPIVSIKQISVYDPESGGVFYDATRRALTAREILSTYSDEPDWGMDNDLWAHPEYGYGYGTQPYGKPEGFTTQAPFHCQYSHENLIVRLFAPEVTEGMVVERLDLMSRLARLAFHTRHPYWGYRFTAWAFHYLQDVGQPYHARAVPFADWRYYLNYALSSKKAALKAEATQKTIERHDRYEFFIRDWMASGYTGPDLSEGSAEWPPVKHVQALFNRITDWSAAHASQIDGAVSGGIATERDLRRYAGENLQVVARATRALLAYCRQ